MDVLAYHAAVTDRDFDGRFSLLQPLTLGSAADLELLMKGGKKASAKARHDAAARAGALKQSMRGSAPDSALNFWLNPDA